MINDKNLKLLDQGIANSSTNTALPAVALDLRQHFDIGSGQQMFMSFAPISLTAAANATMTFQAFACSTEAVKTNVAITAVDTTDDFVTSAAHGLRTGDIITHGSGTPPAGWTAAQPYFVNVISSSTFSIHTSYKDAINDTNRVNLTDAGLNPTFSSLEVKIGELGPIDADAVFEGTNVLAPSNPRVLYNVALSALPGGFRGGVHDPSSGILGYGPGLPYLRAAIVFSGSVTVGIWDVMLTADASNGRTHYPTSIHVDSRL